MNMSGCHVSLSSGTEALGTVETVSGSDVAVHAYRGIPYAQPPVGHLRFCPPRTQPLWPGERDCTKFGAVCPQPLAISIMIHKMINYPDVTPEKMSEDCLFLNVYAPATSSGDSRLPVMVWFHGGAFTIGFSDFYDGGPLASFNDVIVVTVNYRLGVFGFLSTGDGLIPGNNGLLDQIEALKWVQAHIQAFGGDPNNVTIFGESAGGMSSSLHVVSELSRGLFHRAILQSGTATSQYAVVTQQRARELIQPALDKMGYEGKTSEDLVSFLRNKSAEELGDMAEEMHNFKPVVDGLFLTDFPSSLYREGEFHNVPLMTGFTSDEGYVVVTFYNDGKPLPETRSKDEIRSFVLKDIKNDYPKNTDTIADAIIQKYITTEAETNAHAFSCQFADSLTHRMFASPNTTAARAHSANVNAPVYSFEFAYRLSSATFPDGINAEHGSDVISVFGFSFRNEAYTEADRSFSRYLMKYWTNFAKTGDPNGEGLVEWKPFSQTKQTYLILQEIPKTATDYCPDKMAFWEHEVPKMMLC